MADQHNVKPEPLASENPAAEFTSRELFVRTCAIHFIALLVIGLVTLPFVNLEWGIAFNHFLVGYLPDTFEPLKFSSDDPEIFRRLQLLMSNMSIIPMAIGYTGALLYVVVNYKARKLIETCGLILFVYLVTWSIGWFVTNVLWYVYGV